METTHMILKTTDAAYIAGIVDGEGNISLSLSLPKRGGYQFGVRVSVTNTNLDLLNYLKKKVGGNIGKKKSWKGKLDCYRWHLCKKSSVKQFLETLLPYLIIKKESAKIVIEYIDGFVSLQHKDDATKKKEIERRTRLWEKVKVYQVR